MSDHPFDSAPPGPLENLLSVECDSLATGYRMLAEISQWCEANSKQTRVLEASPIGGRFLLLFCGPTAEVEKLQGHVRAGVTGKSGQLVDCERVQHFGKEIAAAFYSLAAQKSGEQVLVVESRTVSGLFAAAQEVLQTEGMAALEIRVQRTSTGGAYGFFSGSKAQCDQALLNLDGFVDDFHRELRYENIALASAMICKHFSLTGL